MARYQARHSAASTGNSSSKSEEAKAKLEAALNAAKKKTASSSSANKQASTIPVRTVSAGKTAVKPAAAASAGRPAAVRTGTAETPVTKKAEVNAPAEKPAAVKPAVRKTAAPIKTTQMRKAPEKSSSPDPLISSTQVMKSVSLDGILEAKRTADKSNAVRAAKPAAAAPSVKVPRKVEPPKAEEEAEISSAEVPAAETVTTPPVKENKPEKNPIAVDIYSDGDAEEPEEEISDISSGEALEPDDSEDYEEAAPKKEKRKRYKADDDYEDDDVDEKKFTFGKLIRIIVSCVAVAGMIFFAVPLFKNYFTGTSLLAEIYCLIIFVLSAFKKAFTKKGKKSMAVVWHIAAILMFLSTCWFGFASYQMFNVDYSKPDGDATVVVLGAKVYSNGVSISLKNRLDSGYSYIATHPESMIVVTGGQGSDEPWSEASAAKAYLLDLGVDEDRILVEDKSTSTEENLEFTKQLLADNNIDTPILLVTQSFHMFRASSMAKDLGYTVYCQSCETNNWLFPTYYSRELLAITKYYLGKVF